MKLRVFWLVAVAVCFFVAKIPAYGQALTVACQQTSFPIIPVYELPYSRTCTASGGIAPYSWSVTGTLPGGLSLTPSGRTAILGGTPQNLGDVYNFSVQVTDGLNQTATQSVGNGTIATCAAQSYASAFPAPFVSPPPLGPIDPLGGNAAWRNITLGGSASGCPWTIGTDVQWITFLTSTSGKIVSPAQPIGDVNFTVAPNPDPVPRHGNLWLSTPGGVLINAQITVNSSSCTYSVNPPSDHLGSSGGSGAFILTSNPSDCAAGRTFSLPALADQSTWYFGLFPNTGSALMQTMQFGSSFGVASGPNSTFTLNQDAGDNSLKLNCIQWAIPRIGARLPVDCRQAGGTGPYNWTVSSGTPPDGTSLTNGPFFGPGLASMSFAGNLQNTGPYHFVVHVTDSSSIQQSASYTVDGTVLPSLPTIICPAFFAARVGPGPYQVGYPYTLDCTANGGTPPYQWSIGGGALPNGLSITPTNGGASATIAGPALVAGPYFYALQVTDSNSTSGSQVFAGTILPVDAPLPLNVLCNPYPTAILFEVGIPMPSITCTVSGGQVPYHFALSGSPLPSGIMMNQVNAATLVFSGTPTTTAQLPFVLTVTDTSLPAAQLVTNSFGAGSFVAPQLTLTCTSNTGPDQVGHTYTTTCLPSGGVNPITTSLSGSLPAGLTLSSHTIAGTPTVPGPYSYTITTTDSLPAYASGPVSVSKTFSGTIAPGTIPTTLSVNCVGSPLGEFTVGVPASPESCTVSGGTPPYIWSISSGALPAGITITGTTANTISFGGTPLVSGLFPVFLLVTDSTIAVPLTATGAISYSVADKLTLSCTSNAGPAVVGVSYSVTCQAKGGHNPYSISVSPRALPGGLTSTVTGAVINDSIIISGTPTSPGPYNYTITLTDASPPAPLTATQSFTGIIAGSATCNYALNPGGQAFPAQGGAGTVNITTTPGCLWAVTNIPAGITLTSPASGTGNGTVSFQVTANNGNDLVSAFTVAGQTFTIEQQAASITGLNFVGTMPHIAAQENWTTAFTLVNKSASSATARLSLFGDPSGTLALPMAFPQQPLAPTPLLAASLDRTLNGNASLITETAGPQTPPVQVGSAQLAATGAVDGFAIFHLIPGAQEAVVPMEDPQRKFLSAGLRQHGWCGFGRGCRRMSRHKQGALESSSATMPVRRSVRELFPYWVTGTLRLFSRRNTRSLQTSVAPSSSIHQRAVRSASWASALRLWERPPR